MDAKEYLMQAQVIQAKLKIIDDVIRKLKRELELLTDVSLKSSWPDGQPHGTITTDPTAAAAAKLAEKNLEKRRALHRELLEYEFQQLKAKSELWRKQMEIIEIIGQVTEPTLYQILAMRYINGKSFEWIAVEIGYTWRHTIRLHGQCIEEVQKILNNKKNHEKAKMS